jgi:hypothetical protein
VIAVDNRQNGSLDATAMGSCQETKMKRILGSVVGATLLCALPVSPHLLNGGGVSFGIERAKAADLDIDRKAPRQARRHIEHVAAAPGYVPGRRQSR